MRRFAQVCIFVKSVSRATELDRLLRECNFPSIAIHSGLQQDERIKRYQQFKAFEKRVLVATDIFGRGIDVERVNIVVNYDTPGDADSYLHRVGRAGRFGTKGLAITFVANDENEEVLKSIQSRFEVAITELPETIEPSTYSASTLDVLLVDVVPARASCADPRRLARSERLIALAARTSPSLPPLPSHRIPSRCSPSRFLDVVVSFPLPPLLPVLEQKPPPKGLELDLSLLRRRGCPSVGTLCLCCGSWVLVHSRTGRRDSALEREEQEQERRAL